MDDNRKPSNFEGEEADNSFAETGLPEDESIISGAESILTADLERQALMKIAGDEAEDCVSSALLKQQQAAIGISGFGIIDDREADSGGASDFEFQFEPSTDIAVSNRDVKSQDDG